VLYWPHAEKGLMNCATYTAENSGLKAGTWIIETQVGVNSPNTCNYSIENNLTSTMKIFIGKNTCESEFEDYLTYADLTPKSFSNPAAPLFRLVVYPGKSLFSNVIENSIRAKIEINGVVYAMQSSSRSRWAYTLEDRCPKLVVINPEKKWQRGFEYNYLIDFDINAEQGTIQHVSQHYPPTQKFTSLVVHASTIYFTSTKPSTTSEQIVYNNDSLSNGGQSVPTWKYTEYCERDKPLKNSYEYEFEIHNLSSKKQISRIEMAPYQEYPANTKFEINATLPVILQCGDLYKFKVQYKPGITDCWSTTAQIGMIKTWVIDAGSHEKEGPALYIDYSLRRNPD